jgi:hypothetical protein
MRRSINTKITSEDKEKCQEKKIEGKWGRVVEQGRHRVDRVPEFLAGRLNWLPHPLPRKRVCSVYPQDPGGGGTHSLVERGLGEPIHSKRQTL